MATANTVAIVPRGASAVHEGVFEWRGMDDAVQVAEYLAQSQFVPKDMRGRPQDIILAVEYGRSLGMHPLQAMQNIAVINGRPSMWGDALLALVMSHPEYRGKKEWIEGDGTEGAVAHCVIRRQVHGEVDEVHETFTVTQAQRAGLWGKAGPWAQYPSRMLKMRARAFAVRDLFADVLKGISFAEEAQDIPTTTHTDAPQQKPTSRAAAETEYMRARAGAKVQQQAEPKPESTQDPYILTLQTAKVRDLEGHWRTIIRDVSDAGKARVYAETLLRWMGEIYADSRAKEWQRELIRKLAIDLEEPLAGIMGDDAIPLLQACGWTRAESGLEPMDERDPDAEF